MYSISKAFCFKFRQFSAYILFLIVFAPHIYSIDKPSKCCMYIFLKTWLNSDFSLYFHLFIYFFCFLLYFFPFSFQLIIHFVGAICIQHICIEKLVKSTQKRLKKQIFSYQKEQMATLESKTNRIYVKKWAIFFFCYLFYHHLCYVCCYFFLLWAELMETGKTEKKDFVFLFIQNYIVQENIFSFDWKWNCCDIITFNYCITHLHVW